MAGRPDQSTIELMPERLGDYRCDRWLGHGGMGVVWCYRDTRLDRLVAVKTLPPALARDPVRRRRLEQEARALAALDHPAIARINHVLEHDGVDYLVLEYVPGDTLQDRLRRGPLSLDEALAVAGSVAAAVEAGHAAGIVHCDVKPANIKITPRGDVKLLDYGIARVVQWRADGASTASCPEPGADAGAGRVAGTPGYMSPEQVRGKGVDGRSDIWAVGCTLYECLTGREAFGGKTRSERMLATLEDEPDWTALADDPPELVRLVRSCLVKDRAERPRTIASTCAMIAAGDRPAVSRRLEAMRTNLVAPLTRFVPRRGEMERLHRLLDGTRLLTLLGPGGVGKSRLATELALDVAARTARGPATVSCADGAWSVPLAPVADPALLPKTLAAVVCHDEIPPDDGAAEALRARLRVGDTLLVLDNCEHLVAGCRELVSDLLRHCPGLRVVATSKVRLGVEGEQTYRLAGLAFPPAGEPHPERYESVRLFVDRATRARHDFEVAAGSAAAVGEICRRLEGIPLAIELAAACVRALPAIEVARRLLAVIDPDDIMESTIATSVRLLGEPEQRLLGRLSTFRGGWSMDAAERVCGDDGDGRIDGRDVVQLLTGLVDRSLVQYEEQDDRARYHLLEPVRAYGDRMLLPETDVADLRRRHFVHFAELAALASSHLGQGGDQKGWLERLELEHDNLRAAAEACATTDGGITPDEEVALAWDLHRFWYMHGHFAEGQAALVAALARRGEIVDVVQCQALNAAGILAEAVGDTATARQRYDASLAIARALGDGARIAGRLTNLGMLEVDEGDLATARRHHEEALEHFTAVGDEEGVSWVQLNLAEVAVIEGGFEEGRRLSETCLETFRKNGDQFREASALHHLALAARHRGAFEEAVELLRQCLTIRRELGDKRFTAGTLLWLGVCLADLGHHEEGVRLLAASDAMRDANRTVIPPSEVPTYERTCRTLRNTLGERRFEAAWSAGRESSFDRSIAEALST